MDYSFSCLYKWIMIPFSFHIIQELVLSNQLAFNSPPKIMSLRIPFHLLLLIHLIPPIFANLEGDALYALRRAVHDPENVLQSWDPTLVDPCTWFHVTCDGDNRVTRLDLGNAKLSGKLVPELGKLERLQYLELYMNNLTGAIPAELGRLKSLVSLDLYHNNLTGSIPPSLSNLSNLKFLRLKGNRLTGRIPRELTKLGNLKIFFMNNSRLEGPELMGFVRYHVGGC